MNPDVAQAIPELVESGILPAAAAPRLLRVARGERRTSPTWRSISRRWARAGRGTC